MRVQPVTHQHVQCTSDSVPPSGGLFIPYNILSLKTFLLLRSGCALIQAKVLAIFQHRPTHPRILGRNRHHRAPVAASCDYLSRPATEVILLVPNAIEHRSRTHDEQTSQIVVSGLGDVAQSSLAAAAVLTGHEADPGRHLSAILEVMPIADTGQ